MRNHSSSVKIGKKNAPYGAPKRAVCGFEAVFRLTHTVNQAVIHHDQYSTAGGRGKAKIATPDTVDSLLMEAVYGDDVMGVYAKRYLTDIADLIDPFGFDSAASTEMGD